MRLLRHLAQVFGFRGILRDRPGGEEITCEEALSVVQEYIDGELSDASLARVKRHFDVCGRCYPQLQTERTFRAAVRRAFAHQRPQGDAPEDLREELLRLLGEPKEI